MKKLLFISFLFLAVTQSLFAQEDGIVNNTSLSSSSSSSSFSLDIGGDIVSKYVWRGLQFGENVPALQPYMEFGAGPIVFGFFGSTGLAGNGSFQEFDFYVGADFMDGMLSAYIYDYYFPAWGGDYFDFDKNTTGHLLELDLSFNGTDNIPFTFLLAVNFYGADALRIDNDPNSVHFNEVLGVKHSTYAEFGYNTKVGGLDFSPFMGFNLTKAIDANPGTGYVGETGFYSNDIGLIHIGMKVSKEIEISDKFSLPIYGQVSSNFQAKQVFWTVGFSF